MNVFQTLDHACSIRICSASEDIDMHAKTTSYRSAVFPLLVLCALACSASGCSTTYTIGDRPAPSGSEPDLDYSQVNDCFRSTGEVTILTHNGRTYLARDLQVNRDTTSFIETSSAEPYVLHLANASITCLQKTDNGLGALEGFGIGILSGAGLGLGLTTASTLGRSDENSVFQRVVGFIGGGLIGGVLGLVTGAIVGHTDSYQFSNRIDP